MEIRHFLITDSGEVREYSNEEAQRIAVGDNRLPEFADAWVRYLQVQFDELRDGDGIKVTTAAASIHFDGSGKLEETAAPKDRGQAFTQFEHDTCVQLALAPALNEQPIAH